MKYSKLKLENFQSATNLTLNFSTDEKKYLTVIRAENSFGKSVCMRAMKWVLFGKKGFSGGDPSEIGHQDYHEISNEPVTVTATLWYEIGKTKYELTRSADVRIEAREIEGTNKKKVLETQIGKDNVTLSVKQGSGDNLLDNPEVHLRTHIPYRDKDIFFIDGDGLQNLVRKDQNQRMEMIDKSIRYLLDLDVIGDAENNLNRVKRSLMNNLGNTNSDLSKQTEQLELIEQAIEKCKNDIEDYKKEIITFSEARAKVDQKIIEATATGNPKEIRARLSKEENSLEKIQENIKTNTLKQSRLLGEPSLFSNILHNELQAAKKKVSKLKGDKFPKSAVAVVKEILKKGVCVCGEKIDGTESCKHRLKTLEDIISGNPGEDELSEMLSALHYDSSLNIESDTWETKLNNLIEDAEKLIVSEAESQMKIRQHKQDLKACREDIDLDKLIELRDRHSNAISELNNKKGGRENQLKTFISDKQYLENDINRQIVRNKETAKIQKQITVTQDMQSVLTTLLKTHKYTIKEELGRSITEIYLKLASRDIETSSYGKIDLDDKFDLQITGNSGAYISWDILNGAAKRALTIAFVLALVSMAKTKRPVMMDNPGAATSGMVLQSLMENSIKYGKGNQLILFIYRDEIRPAKKTIHRYAEKEYQYTISHPGGEKTALKNELKIGQEMGIQSIVRCDCDIDKKCSICELKD